MTEKAQQLDPLAAELAAEERKEKLRNLGKGQSFTRTSTVSKTNTVSDAASAVSQLSVNPSNSMESVATTTAGDSIAPSSKVGDEVQHDEQGYKMALLNSKQTTKFHHWRSFALDRKLARLEKYLTDMRDIQTGVNFKDIKGLFDVKPSCAMGIEIATWILDHGKFDDPLEAKRVLIEMQDYGYIIPLDAARTTFVEDDSLYTYQGDFFFPSKAWDVNKMDYLLFLQRKDVLIEDEKERIASLEKEFVSHKLAVKEAYTKQKKYLSKLDKREKKLFELREAAFWRQQRPLASSRLYFENTPLTKLKKKRVRPEQIDSKLKDEDLAQYYQKQAALLLPQVNIYRASVSVGSKQLIARCDLRSRMDPLVRPERFRDNNWFRDEEKPWKEEVLPEQPTYSQVKLWSNSFKDMVTDPLGAICFQKFLEADFSTENFLFYQRCQELDLIAHRADFFSHCAAICADFVEPNSKHELNLLAAQRDAILALMKTSTPETLPIRIFDEALDHITHLMQTASYVRFMQSPAIKQIVA